ncbi:MAG TPA: hypothetical protein VK875_07620 [Euzebyales bacterium]|nr:hypothetical protein [Euzebyales bacterium]
MFDACVAVFVCAFDVWQLVDPPAGGTVDRLAGAAFLAAAAVPLLWRRRHAIAVLAALTLVNLAWFAVPSVTTPPLEHFNAGFIAFIVSLYSVGLYASSPRAAVVAAVVALGAILPTAALTDEEFQSNPRVFFLNAAIIAIFFSSDSSVACSATTCRSGRLGWSTNAPRTRAAWPPPSAPASPASCTMSSPTAWG